MAEVSINGYDGVTRVRLIAYELQNNPGADPVAQGFDRNDVRAVRQFIAAGLVPDILNARLPVPMANDLVLPFNKTVLEKYKAGLAVGATCRALDLSRRARRKRNECAHLENELQSILDRV